MAKLFDAQAVAKHNTPQSCWVSLYGDVYDVTSFLSSHPGGSKIILQLAGRDATEEYDPIHPRGTLEANLSHITKLGRLEPSTIAPSSLTISEKTSEEEPIDLQSLLNLDEIETVATKRLSPKAWAYYFSASDDLFSKTFNGAIYRKILLRPRIFVDCVRCDTSTTLLGHRVGLPLYVSPAALARLGHPSGEKGIAEGISSFGALQIISHNASMTPEEIVADCQEHQMFGWQLYVQNDRSKSEAMLARINALAPIKFIVLTLDAPVPGKREHDERIGSIGKGAPVSSGSNPKAAQTNSQGGVGKGLFFGTAADLTWKSTLAWLKLHTQLPIVLKGVQTHEDAYLAMQFAPQVRGIILSNHGGRALDTAPPAVHTLLEIRKYCPEVFSRLEVWVDGGIKRGTDVVKALCLGAKAVGVGRAALYGLAAGGPDGVKRTMEILRDEVETCMRLLGVGKVEELGLRHVNARAVEGEIYDAEPGLEKVGLWVKARL